MNIQDNKVIKDFVSPTLCKELMIKGFQPDVNYFWRGHNHKEIELMSFIFDIDNYYKDSYAFMDKISRPIYLIPAFTIKDIDHHMPPYCVCKDNFGMYEIMVDEQYEVASEKSDRLPDAYAKIFIKLLEARAINLSVFQKSKPKT